MQRAVGVPVATSVEPVPHNLAPRGFYRRDSAEAGERRLALQPLGVVPYRHKQRGCVVRADAGQSHELRSHLRDQPRELDVELSAISSESDR
jgi:hypothetical protein